MEKKKLFYFCKVCGKKLIERQEDGLFRFIFGKGKENEHKPPVDMIIHGNIKMRCIRRSCQEWNVFNLYPMSFNPLESKSETN